MGGSINVESQIGKGSTFSVTLPIQIDTSQDARPLEKERNVHANMGGTHVLLVEDNEINCEIVEFILEQAGAADFVRELPNGLETLLYKDKEGGVDISGGQAQKLALARALYKDAPFVVLDEPTAALDPVSEAQVYEGFHKMVKDKTSIYISHRMSSCRFCDDIVVFDAGRIVERGSHEKLLAEEGQYAKMWNAQAKYYVT